MARAAAKPWSERFGSGSGWEVAFTTSNANKPCGKLSTQRVCQSKKVQQLGVAASHGESGRMEWGWNEVCTGNCEVCARTVSR